MWDLNGQDKGEIGGYVGGSLLIRFDLGGSSEPAPAVKADADAEVKTE